MPRIQDIKVLFHVHLRKAEARERLTRGRNTHFARLQRDLDALAGGKAMRALSDARRDLANQNA